MTDDATGDRRHRIPYSVTDFSSGPVRLRGALAVERTEAGWLPRRLPLWTKAQYPDDYMADMVVQPAGVRLAFRTAADAVELDVLPTHGVWRGDPVPERAGGFDLVVDGVVRAAGETRGAGNVEFFHETGVVDRRPGRGGPARFERLA